MKNYWARLKYLLLIHISGILFFTLFRVIFLIANHPFYTDVEGKAWYIFKSLLIGLRFDNVVACYIMLIPLCVVALTSLLGLFRRAVMTGVNVFFQVMYIITFAIEAANIPYFKYFFNHLNSSIFNWMEYSDTTASMIFGETSYWVYLGILVAISWGWVRLTNHYLRQLKQAHARQGKFWQEVCMLPVSAILIGLTVIGLRGSVYVSPIRTGAAFFCNNPFFNQVGNHPMFNLVRSTLDLSSRETSNLALLDNEQALGNAMRYLHAERSGEGQAALTRQVKNDSAFLPGKPNVVLIFMESMSAELMDRHGNGMGITPFLDSLSWQSLYFDRFYSAGNHTNQGVYSTLYSFPSILKRNMMKNSVIPNYHGLPSILQENGYHTLFFMPHEAQYDNMNGFLLANGFETLYSQEDYPFGSKVNCWGVSDEFLLDYAIPVLTACHEEGRPFFGALLTVSNHPPYVIPEHFHPKTDKPETQIVEFADYALRKFFTRAQREPWFENTVFVLVADHGKVWKTPLYTIPTSFNHVPLIIYSPKLAPAVCSNLGGQIDIAPTLLGILGIDYQDTSLGVNLLREQRPCMFFTSDDAIGCVDSTYFYIYKPREKKEQLFRYAHRETEDLHTTLTAETDSLRNYAWSMLQAAQYVTDGIMEKRMGR